MSLSMLSMLTGGGPLPIPRIPCAPCAASWRPNDEDDPAQAETLVGGTLVCRAHAGELLDTFDRGHIAAAVTAALTAALLDDGGELARARDALERLGLR